MMMILLLILLLSFFHVTMIDYLYNNPTYYQLDAYTYESDDFRSMKLGNLIAESGPIDYDLLTSLMIEHNYDLTDSKDTICHTDRLLAVKPAEYRKLKQAYETVLGDLKFFPIPENTNAASPPVTFENGWMDKRTYGGERGHEGCDIMGTERPRGYYPVVSMSDGVVEKVGWLEKGGYRIGVTADSGTYYYYAHLDSYANIQKGDRVKAGQLLGYMGDTGYGEEGTKGKFDVHLHVGIYSYEEGREVSVNPYYVLLYLENKKLKYAYS